MRVVLALDGIGIGIGIGALPGGPAGGTPPIGSGAELGGGPGGPAMPGPGAAMPGPVVDPLAGSIIGFGMGIGAVPAVEVLELPGIPGIGVGPPGMAGPVVLPLGIAGPGIAGPGIAGPGIVGLGIDGPGIAGVEGPEATVGDLLELEPPQPATAKMVMHNPIQPFDRIACLSAFHSNRPTSIYSVNPSANTASLTTHGIPSRITHGSSSPRVSIFCELTMRTFFPMRQFLSKIAPSM